MSSARDSTSIRILLAFGAAFITLGWGLREFAIRYFPGLDAASFGVGAAFLGCLAAGIAFALGRCWRPKEVEREHQLNHGILTNAAHSIISTDAHGMVETFSAG